MNHEDNKNALERTKHEIEIHRLLRHDQLEKYEDYIGFITAKIAGIALVIVGSLEILTPESIPAVLPEPAGLVGVGFALLAGNKAARFLARVLEVYKK